MTVEAVVFDIGNVLINWQPERLYDRIFGADARKAMFDAVDLHGMNDRVDQGQSWKQTVYETAEAHPEFSEMIQLWHDRWLDMASPAIDASVSVLRAVRRRGVPVLALSNFGIETFELAETHYPFLQEFDQRYISGHLGVTKPDPRIYGIVEEQCGFRPETLLFVDDRPENIAAAVTRGWQGHQFRSAGEFASLLCARGLLAREDLTMEV